MRVYVHGRSASSDLDVDVAMFHISRGWGIILRGEGCLLLLPASIRARFELNRRNRAGFHSKSRKTKQNTGSGSGTYEELKTIINVISYIVHFARTHTHPPGPGRRAPACCGARMWHVAC